MTVGPGLRDLRTYLATGDGGSLLKRRIDRPADEEPAMSPFSAPLRPIDLSWGLAALVATLLSAAAIVVTRRYPPRLFEYNVGVLRWTWRVVFFAFGGLGTDTYPPFSLGAEPDYAATLDVAYPALLSRRLVLVKSWLLVLPHYLVLGLFLGGGWWLLGPWQGLGLVSTLTLIAGVTLLMTGRYPDGLLSLIVGLDRWVLRVAVYALLMTDAYPPFRLDLGVDEPGAIARTFT